MNRRAMADKMARRALRHIEIAWKLCREIVEYDPTFYSNRNNDVLDSAHHHVKPLFNRLEEILRGCLQKRYNNYH